MANLKSITVGGSIIDLIFPIGSILCFKSGSQNPNNIYPGTTWQQYAQGRMIIGSGTSDATYSSESSGGESKHTLTVSELASHSHQIDIQHGDGVIVNGEALTSGLQVNGRRRANTIGTGSSQPHNNMPPYIVANYWVRIA